MSENITPHSLPHGREFLFRPTIFARVTSILAVNLVRKFSNLGFVLVSAVALLTITGCSAYQEKGLCSYLFGCGSNPYSSDPGVHHDTPYDYGTYDDGNDDNDDNGDEGR